MTLAAVKALEKKPRVLCFDAHMDLRDEFMGTRLCHATVMRRVAQLVGAQKIMEVGVRAFSSAEGDYAKRAGLKVVTSRDVTRMGLPHVSRSLAKSVRSEDCRRGPCGGRPCL